MARVTVEDCIDKVDSRFDLILLAAHRARQISQGETIMVERNNDKNTVISLREIAEEAVSPEDLKESLIHAFQKHVEVDEPDNDFYPDCSDSPHETEQIAASPSNTFNRMSEDDLLSKIENLVAPMKNDDY